MRHRRIDRLISRALAALGAAALGLGVVVVPALVAPTAAHASYAGSAITSTEVMLRAENWVDRKLTYLNSGSSTWAPDPEGDEKYRRDCSGLVSMAWHMPKMADGWDGSTGHFESWIGTKVIRLGSFDQLQAGDAILRHGFKGLSDHIELFSHWGTRNGVYGGFFYSFNSTGEYVRSPYTTSNHGNVGFRSKSAIVNDFEHPIRYAGLASADVLDFLLSDRRDSSVNTQPVTRLGNVPMVPIVGDWNGDGYDTPGVYIMSSGAFHLTNSRNSGPADYVVRYGNPGDVPLVGDWDGDGKDNIGVRQGITFALRLSPVSSSTETTRTVAYGNPGDPPLIGDWDGDGLADVGVRQGITFALRTSPTSSSTETTRTIAFGNVGDTPLIGDWNADGESDIGLRRGTTFIFRVVSLYEPTRIEQIAYGDPHTLPLIGDWNGDGYDTQGVVA